jgi:nucleotidyltransferase substrate binding protein (TIGR01987 family)
MGKKKDKDIRWEQRFSNYKKALLSLEEFIQKGKLSKLETQGLIKAFEYTYELAWNTLKDYLEYQGETNLTGARDTIKRAFKIQIIEDGQLWLDMLESRNRTSHVYNEETAKEISQAIKNKYYKLFNEFKDKMDRYLS